MACQRPSYAIFFYMLEIAGFLAPSCDQEARNSTENCGQPATAGNSPEARPPCRELPAALAGRPGALAGPPLQIRTPNTDLQSLTKRRAPAIHLRVLCRSPDRRFAARTQNTRMASNRTLASVSAQPTHLGSPS